MGWSWAAFALAPPARRPLSINVVSLILFADSVLGWGLLPGSLELFFLFFFFLRNPCGKHELTLWPGGESG